MKTKTIMKNFLNKIWQGIQKSFWLNIPYIIYSTVWLFLSMFWAVVFLKWFMKNYI